MASLDRNAARALVDAGFMPIGEYVRLYGGQRDEDVASPPLVPDRQPQYNDSDRQIPHH